MIGPHITLKNQFQRRLVQQQPSWQRSDISVLTSQQHLSSCALHDSPTAVIDAHMEISLVLWSFVVLLCNASTGVNIWGLTVYFICVAEISSQKCPQ